MENTQYHDTPPPSLSSSPTRRPRAPSTSSSHSSSTIKPLPPTPHPAPAYEPYRDHPATTYRDDPTTYHDESSPHPPAYQHHQPSTPATDDNIPLALLHPSYPPTSPPPYSVAIQHHHAYHSTPIFPSPRRAVLVEIDPESGEVVSRTDDVRHGVERVVAMFVVAVVLLFVSGFLGFIALGS